MKWITIFFTTILAVQQVQAQFPLPYCAESYLSGVEPITLVKFSNINQSSSASLSSIAHENYTAVVGNVSPGITYPITLKGNTDGTYTTYLRVCIDWNKNNSFADAGESYDCGTIYNSTGIDAVQLVANITIPAAQSTGAVRMRVTKKFNSYSAPCNTSGFGQSEDYTLQVAPPPPCTASAGSTVLTPSSSSCPGGSTTMSLTGAAIGTGLSYLWQSSADSISWNTIAAATSNTYVASAISANTYYRCLVTCTVTGTTNASVAKLYRINSLPVTTNYIICAGQQVPNGQGLTATGVGNVTLTSFTGSIAGPAVYARSLTGTTYTASGVGTAVFYNTHTFQVTVAGSYTFDQCAATYDGFGSMYTAPFTPSTPAVNYLIGDDDGNSTPACNGVTNVGSDSRLTLNLTTGIDYTLVSSSFSNGVTGAYEWTFTGPGSIIIPQPNPIVSWYATSTGGSSIATGSPWNPIGVTGSGIANNNSAGTYTYYAQVLSACTPVQRTAATFTINAATNANGLAGNTGGIQVCTTGNVVAAGTTYYDAQCNLIADVVPSGSIPVGGAIKACVTVDNTVQIDADSRPYVQRHFDIEPTTNAANATALVKMYFTQAEFDAFNTYIITNGLPYPLLPTNTSDNGNARITQFHGTGTALGNYNPGTISFGVCILTWDAATLRWQASIPVLGFSGFYLHTGSSSLLASKALILTAYNTGIANTLNWSSTDAGTEQYQIYSSKNGINFDYLTTIQAIASNTTTYVYKYVHVMQNSNTYYRVYKIANAQALLSNIVLVQSTKQDLTVSPNPTTGIIMVHCNAIYVQATISLLNAQGKIILELKIKNTNAATINLSKYPAGIYTIRVQDDISHTTATVQCIKL